MYILVKNDTNVIIGSAIKPISEYDCNQKNITLYEVDDSEYNDSMIGKRLVGFGEV